MSDQERIERLERIVRTLSEGEFVAMWPQWATARDFKHIRVMLNAVLDAWEENAIEAQENLEAGDIEYSSWLPRAAASIGKKP